MARRRLYDSDPVVNGYIDNSRRAGMMLQLAFGLGLAWAVVAYLGRAGGPAAIGAVPRLVATVFGWAALFSFCNAVVRFAYDCLYPWRD